MPLNLTCSCSTVDWADLVTLDLSKFSTPDGRRALADQLKTAMHSVGFFYITNFGLTQEQVDRQFAIGKEIFELPVEEKLKYRADLEHGDYNGYRPRGSIELFPGLRDNVEMYNVFKFIPELERSQPKVVQEHRAEIERFQRHIAQDVVQKLLVLIAIVLEMPEDTLIEGHKYDDVSECHLYVDLPLQSILEMQVLKVLFRRYIIYRARTAEENAKYENLYSRGHTDFGL